MTNPLLKDSIDQRSDKPVCACGKWARYSSTCECATCYRRRWRHEHPKPDRRIGKRAEQKRRWDEEARHPCAEPGCDVLVGHGNTVCAGHRDEAKRIARDERWRHIERMWNDGMTMTAIAADLGITRGGLSRTLFEMREEGWNVPHRYAMQDGRRVAA